MRSLSQALLLLLALSTAVPAFSQFDFETTNARAALGFADAQYSLGVMYIKGQNVAQSDQEAVKWFRLAAGQGNSSAQYNLGVMYANGRGVVQNDQEAVKWYRLAAEQGNSSAQYNLGVMYANGRGLVQNDLRAYVWLSVAAVQGDADAAKNRDIVRNKLSQPALEQAQTLATRCFESGFKDCE